MIRVVVGRGRYLRQVKMPFWAFALAGAAVVLIGFLLLTFLASLAIFVIPACLIGAGAAHWLALREFHARADLHAQSPERSERHRRRIPRARRAASLSRFDHGTIGCCSQAPRIGHAASGVVETSLRSANQACPVEPRSQS